MRWSYVGLCENANSVFVTHKKARAHLWNCKIPERKKRNFRHMPLARICNKKKISWQSDKKDKKISFIQLCPWQPSVLLSAVRELLLKYCLELRWVTKCCKYLCKFASLQNLFHVWKNMSDLVCIKQTLQLENLSEMLIHQYYHNSNLPVPVTTELKYFRFW